MLSRTLRYPNSIRAAARSLPFRVPAVVNEDADPARDAERSEPVTETFSVLALRMDRADARGYLRDVPGAFGVRLDSVQERPRRLNVEFVVTVTGEIDAVEKVRNALGGRATLSAGNPFDAVLNEGLISGVKRFQKWRRSQTREHGET
jgi:hypothetical protein